MNNNKPIYKTNLKKTKIPIFGITTVAAGFYVGYNESRGVRIDGELENILKYGPTALATITSPIVNKLNNTYLKYLVNKLSQIKEQDEIMITGETKKRYKDLDEKEKLEIIPKIASTTRLLESKLENSQYLKPIINAFTFTAMESITGYVLGKAVGYNI